MKWFLVTKLQLTYRIQTSAEGRRGELWLSWLSEYWIGIKAGSRYAVTNLSRNSVIVGSFWSSLSFFIKHCITQQFRVLLGHTMKWNFTIIIWKLKYNKTKNEEQSIKLDLFKRLKESDIIQTWAAKPSKSLSFPIRKKKISISPLVAPHIIFRKISILRLITLK